MTAPTASSPKRAIGLLEIAGVILVIVALSLVIASPKTQDILLTKTSPSGEQVGDSVKNVFDGFEFLWASPHRAFRTAALWGFFALPLVFALRRRWLPEVNESNGGPTKRKETTDEH